MSKSKNISTNCEGDDLNDELMCIMAEISMVFKGFISEKKILLLCSNEKDKVLALMDRGLIQPQKNCCSYEVTEKGWHWFSKNQQRLMAMPLTILA